MLQKIIEWGKKEENIRALILLGSRAGNGPVDSLSDYDVSVFCNTDLPYTTSETWLSQFRPVWVCVKEKVFYGTKIFPSRLVIFEGGIKIDFSFLNTEVFQNLPNEYAICHKVLIDKDNKTSNMPTPKLKWPAVKPQEAQFYTVIDEFWFEVYHVGVYLRRKDLWSVKFRSWATHTFLLQMIQWHAEAKNQWSYSVPLLGKQISSWVSSDVWHDLQDIFARFDAEDSLKALFKTMELFKRLTNETAKALCMDNKKELSENMTHFIEQLQVLK